MLRFFGCTHNLHHSRASPDVRLGLKSQAQRHASDKSDWVRLAVRFNVLGLLALKFISRWECGQSRDCCKLSVHQLHALGNADKWEIRSDDPYQIPSDNPR